MITVRNFRMSLDREDPHVKLCTVNDASQNNHELVYSGAILCVQSHRHRHKSLSTTVCMCSVCYLHSM